MRIEEKVEKSGLAGSSIAHFMRRFGSIVNEESENSNAEGDAHNEAFDLARDNEIERIF